MVAPDLTGDAGGVAQLLMNQLVVPRLTHAKRVHGANFYVGDHLRRGHDDRLHLSLRVDTARGQPITQP